jgi:photosystem II stability/assembly factor-like uncharacterized protein
MRRQPLLVIVVLLFVSNFAAAKSKTGQKEITSENGADLFSAKTFKGLELRGIGPALTSGRVVDFAVHPENRKTYYVAVASGGVWRTRNAGTTWEPIFDREGSYSIGCITMDPNDPLTIWVGTGENNSQRSVGYGDGVYKSVDGGTTWKNVGLKKSEHIGMIVVDPSDSDTVYVAAQGPLWSAGGDRGLYKTVDGGESWEKILDISEHTGVSEVVMDPRDPEVLYAVAYQRRRRVWTLIHGGPESGIYKTVDAGGSWRKLGEKIEGVTKGLPQGDIGRIGLALSPVNPDVVYAIVEAANKKSGFFRSVDGGSIWEKRSDYVSRSPQYYQEIVADPQDIDRVYSNDVWMHVSEDGGKTFNKLGEEFKHVDNHALWIDPSDTDYLLVGCDGGIYESFDRGVNWEFRSNLPITQFYKIAVDNAMPFYNVYGGTQDNFTLGGPSRTTTVHGIMNSDWFITRGGDGFQPRVDPEDPNIVYSEAQYGELVRFDRRSGEKTDIQPQPGADEAPIKFNWDAPLIISPHLNTRLYFGGDRLFRSDDRGNSWRAVSPDLTRQLDRNRLEVMGKVWGVDAVAKNKSTSIYGNLVALTESPLVEGLLYAGTDDGLVQVTEDGGGDWRRLDRFPGVPEMTYVNRLEASQHDANTIFVAFNNHKSGDFEPYLLKSTDRGATWVSIAGDLPKRGSVYALVEDPVDPELLFAGTEFGLFFTSNGGGRWTQLKGGLPTIAVRDLAIQEREGDLIVGTFGRGFYILDDYTALRDLTKSSLEEEAILFPVRRAWMFMPSAPLGLREKSFQGAAFFTAPNPPFGAEFTYYLKNKLKTRKKLRQEREKLAAEKGEPSPYPDWEELRREDHEDEPKLLVSIQDVDGNQVRYVDGANKAGFQRASWDLRYPAPHPTQLGPQSEVSIFSELLSGPVVAPGTYRAQLMKQVDGELIALGSPVQFSTEPLGLATLPAEDREQQLAFQRQTAELQRAVLGSIKAVEAAHDRVTHLKQTLFEVPKLSTEMHDRLIELEARVRSLEVELTGDKVVSSRYEATAPSISQRVNRMIEGQWTSTSEPTQTNLDAYSIAGAAFVKTLKNLRQLVEVDLPAIEAEFEAAGAPWTPGRVPRWEMQ